MNNEEINKRIDKLSAELAEPKAQVNKPENDEWPKVRGIYYSHTFKHTSEYFFFSGCDIDKYRKSIGNMFRTKEEAEHRVEQLKLIQELREFGGDEGEYFLWATENFKWSWARGYNGLVQFPSREKVIEAIKHFGDHLNILLPKNK